MEDCKALEKHLDDLLEKYEVYWFIRSRVADVKDGDENTKYFHHKASQRKKRNYILGVHDSNGVWKTEQEDLEEIVISFYSELFSSTNSSTSNLDEALEGITKKVTDETNQKLL